MTCPRCDTGDYCDMDHSGFADEMGPGTPRGSDARGGGYSARSAPDGRFAFRIFRTARLDAVRYRHAAQSALRELARLDPELAPGLIDSAMRNLRDVLEASHRVTDLLAAEQEIARSRGHHS